MRLGTSDIPHSQALLPLRDRSSASRTPTASGQKRTPRANTGLRPEAKPSRQPRPSARSKTLAPAHVRRLSSPRRHSASAAGVGALGGYDGSDGLRSGPRTKPLGTPDIPHSQALLPLRDRSSASRTPTASGQKRKPRSSACPSAIFATPPRRHSASAAGVGALGGYDGSDGLRSGPETMRLGTSDIPHSQALLPLRDRSSASRTPTACGQKRTPRANKRPSARGGPLAPTNGLRPEAKPSLQHMSVGRRHSASAAGVGALGGYDGSDGLRSGPETMRLGTSDIPHSQALLPLRDRSSASRTPTACGQKQKPRSSACPSSIFATPPFCFCRRRRSSRRLRRQRWAAKRP